MGYYKRVFTHTLVSPESDLFVSDLGDLGFESFEQEAVALIGYWPETAGKPEEADAAIADVMAQYGHVQAGGWEKMPDVNWNQAWESHYAPVQIGDFCFVHAPFHTQRPAVKHFVEIEPKMSFGTAHHPTTALMIEFIAENDWEGRQVVDMGCGTGILGLLAAKEGAAAVSAIDYDDWACANARENVARNHLSDRITVTQGSGEQLAGRRVDAILANINRNILLRDLPAYAEALRPGGRLFLSGFYESDVPVLRERAEALDFTFQALKTREAWTALAFQYR